MFPPVEWADDDGLLAMGGDLRPATLRAAYRGGIFPWPVEGYPILWFAPPQRAILRFDEFHISRRLARELRQSCFECRINANFSEVILSCATPRGDDGGTWITAAMSRAYNRLHRSGEAHSVEAYCDGELVGGLYGVSFGAYFAGESMFFRQSGASKAALVYLVAHLQARGATWLDCQMMTPLFESFGAREVPRDEFMAMLAESLKQPVQLFD